MSNPQYSGWVTTDQKSLQKDFSALEEAKAWVADTLVSATLPTCGHEPLWGVSLKGGDGIPIISSSSVKDALAEEPEPLSQCCGAPPLGEIFNNFAICSDCKEQADFSPEED